MKKFNNKAYLVDFAIIALYVAIFKIHLVPVFMQQAMKMFLLFLVALYVVTHSNSKQLLTNKTIPLCISIIVSGFLSWLAGYISLFSAINGILHSICLYLIYGLLDVCRCKKFYDRLFNCLFEITSLYCLISLISIALKVNSGNKSEILYIFGYKFMTSYYFILWLALFGIKYTKKLKTSIRYRCLYALCTMIVLLVCLWVDCKTSIVAMLLIAAWQIFPSVFRALVCNRYIALLSILAAGSVPIIMDDLLSLPIVQDFIQETLGRSLSLTGRMPIYHILPDLISERSFFGYGYGNTLIFDIFDYGNAQNGLAEHVLSYGFVGGIVLLFTIFRCLKGKPASDTVSAWYMIFYTMVITSTVEISFNYIFYFSLFALAVFIPVSENDLSRKTPVKKAVREENKRK